MKGSYAVLYFALGAALVIGLLGASQGTVAAQTPGPLATGVDFRSGVVETRTPVPTATPGPIEAKVDQLAAQSGLARTRILGLYTADWINLGISLLIVLAAYLVGTLLIRRVLPRLARRTLTVLDDAFLAQAGPGLRWLFVIAVLSFATGRLAFAAAGLKRFLADVYFVLALIVAVRVVWSGIALVERQFRDRAAEGGRAAELARNITFLVRVCRVTVVFLAVTVLLSHFGINVAALAAALGLGGLAISLAAKDTIADAIAGLIILVDRPFRIGDRIEIQGVGTWGDVTDIGLRTTRIRTRDNRMVIVPNSVIGANQVINYTYPDPRYRIETSVGIAYGTDIERARQVIMETVRQLEEVLPDKPVEVLYAEMGASAMIFKVRWWIGSYVDARRVEDRVHTALQHALDEACIECPFPTQSVKVQVGVETAELLIRATNGTKGARWESRPQEGLSERMDASSTGT